MTVFPAMQVYLPSLGLLGFSYLFLRLRSEGKLSGLATRRLLAAVAVLFLGSVWYGLNGYRAMRELVELQPGQVRSICFFDEGADQYRFAGDPEAHPECLERELTDPDRIASFVLALPHLTPYGPNHEGARNRYLVRIGRTDGTFLRFILGKGTRYASDVAWIELNSNTRDGWHYGVYLNRPLHRELVASSTLSKW